MIRSATRPPEQQGLTRDAVRLLAATPDGLAHARFADLPRFLAPGDLLVVNNSATIPAAIPGRRAGGQAAVVHLSAVLDDGFWLIELRDPAGRGRVTDAMPGEVIRLDGGASLELLARYPNPAADRLWTATAGLPGRDDGAAPPSGDGAPGAVGVPQSVGDYLSRHGRAIRYSYVPDSWPLAAYQTAFARVPGSAEMPSAARPFTPELVTSLIAAGVLIAPVTLHAGVASLEAGEPPLPERFAVPGYTAELVNLTRAAGRRVIAVGTTGVRALESAVGPGQQVGARCGWTRLVLRPGRPARVVTGLITGWHEPGASHLDLLRAVAGDRLVRAAYAEAEQAGYLWHEFGDSCLLLRH